MTTLQAREVWEALGEWVTEAKPELGPGTKQRFDMASQLQPDEASFCPQSNPDVVPVLIVPFINS